MNLVEDRDMALIDGAFKGGGGVLIGFGADLAASSALPRIGYALRPAARAVVKGMLAAVDASGSSRRRVSR